MDATVVNAALAALDSRTFKASDGKTLDMSKSSVLRRIEEDRERHKRLRERLWILPIPPLRPGSGGSPASPNPSPFTPASPAPATSAAASSASSAAATKLMPPPPPRAGIPTPLDVEFDQMWETTSDLDDEDIERMRE